MTDGSLREIWIGKEPQIGGYERWVTGAVNCSCCDETYEARDDIEPLYCDAWLLHGSSGIVPVRRCSIVCRAIALKLDSGFGNSIGLNERDNTAFDNSSTGSGSSRR